MKQLHNKYVCVLLLINGSKSQNTSKKSQSNLSHAYIPCYCL